MVSAFLYFHFKDIFYYPIHKMRKLLVSAASFRPISFPFCVSKLFKRIILWRLLFFWSSTPFSLPARPISALEGLLLIKFYFSQSILNGFDKPKPGSPMILVTIDFSKAFDSVWHPTFFANFFQLASLLALLVRLNLSFPITTLAWFFKIAKVAPFESIWVFRKNPFLFLYFSFFLSMISLLLYLLPSAVLFMLTTWSLGSPLPRPLLRWNYKRSSDYSVALV